MIVILYPAGTFGSTIEYCIRQYTNEFNGITANINSNGNMHTYEKEFHPRSFSEYPLIHNQSIITPVYPTLDGTDCSTAINTLIPYLPTNRVVAIRLANIEQYCRNMLFCFHKTQHYLDLTLANTYKRWGNYNSVSEMPRWALRECASHLVSLYSQYTTVKFNPEWLVITPDSMLNNFEATMLDIFNYYNLEYTNGIDNFACEWLSKQHYILDEFASIQNAVSLDGGDFGSLSVMGEAIVQGLLRHKGYELKCDGLEVFPKSTRELLDIIV